MKIRNLIFALTCGMAMSNAALGANASVSAGTELTAGEVRKIDKDAGKVTIRHAAMKNLDMPAMTMVFHVKDPAMIDKLKVGDKINFIADKLNGAYTVTSLETAK